MIRRFRTVVVGTYLAGVYRPIRVIQIPYVIPYPQGRLQTVAAGAGEVLVQGGAVTVLDENSVAPAAGEVLVTGGAVTVTATVSTVEADHGGSGGSGGQIEWFERRNQEDDVILQVIAEFLKQAA